MSILQYVPKDYPTNFQTDNIEEDIEEDTNQSSILQFIPKDYDVPPVAVPGSPDALIKMKAAQQEQADKDAIPKSFLDAPMHETSRAVIGGLRDTGQELIDWVDTGKDFLVSNVLKATGNRVLDFGDNDDEWEFSDLIPQVKEREGTIESATEGTLFTLPEVDKNETVVGQVARDLTRFIAGAITAKKLRQATGLLSKGNRIADPKTRAGKWGAGIADAVIGSQIVSSGDEGRMSDILAEVPWIMESDPEDSDNVKKLKEVASTSIDFLKTNPEDSVAWSRTKMAIEDVIVALPVDLALRTIKSTFGYGKDAVRKAIGKEADDTLEKATKHGIYGDTTDIKVLNYDKVFDKQEFIANGQKFNIKFKSVNKKTGKETPLFSGADDGVDELVEEIHQDLLLKMGKAAGTKASNLKTLQRSIDSQFTYNQLKVVPKYALTPELITATRILFAASANNLKRIADSIVEPTKATALKTTLKTQNLQAKLAQAFTRHVAIQEKLTGMTAQAGRTLQALNMDIGMDALLQSKHLDDLVVAFGSDPSSLARRISKGGSDAIKAIADKRMTTSNWEKLNEVLYFNYLSSPSTWGINIVGNAFTQVYETLVSTPLAATVGAVKSPFVKQADRVYFSEVFGRLQGSAVATLDAFKNFGRTFWNQDLPPELKNRTASEYEEIIKGGIGRGPDAKYLTLNLFENKAFGAVVRLPGSILLGTDAFFKTFGKSAYAHQMAQRSAIDKGFSLYNPLQKIKISMHGKTKKMTKAEYIRLFLSDKRLEREALEDAARVTFTKDNIVAKGVSKIKKVPVLGNITALYLPFVRTPINLLEYSLDNSIFAPLLPKFRKAIKEGGAASDEAVGRMMAGSAIMGLAGTMAYGGKLTGSGDSNYRKRVVANAALGWQEKSWRDKDGNYHSYNRFDPGATPVGFAVDLVDMVMRLNYMSKEKPDLRLEKYVESAAKMMGYSMWSNMADKAMLAGVATLAEDLISAKRGLTNDADFYNRIAQPFLKQAARGVLPNALRLFGRTVDPFIRDTYTVSQVLKDAIPFYRNNIPPRYNMFGEIMYIDQFKEKGFLNSLKQMGISVSRESISKNDAFGKELLRAGWEHERPDRSITISGQRVKLSPEQYSIYEGIMGYQFHQFGLHMLHTDQYKKAVHFKDGTLVQKYLKDIKTSAREFAQAVLEQTYGSELYSMSKEEFLRSRNKDDLKYWEYLPEFMQKDYKIRAGIEEHPN